MYIKRHVEEVILKMSKEFPVIMICGPRQVGKSTMLKMIKNDTMKYITLDDLDARNLALTDPKYFLEVYSYPLIIDEIQYAPNLLSYIKIIVDEKRYESLLSGKQPESLFWLTGSQQFAVMKDVSESLAGRVGILNLSSLSLSEQRKQSGYIFHPEIQQLKNRENIVEKDNESIFEKIFNGGMPNIVAQNVDRDTFFSSYIKTYIERDIRDLANVGKTIEFHNFVQYLAVRTAQEIEYSTISRDIGVDSKTVARWISILKSTGIIYLVRPYATNETKRIIKKPKLYFMDTGLCSWLAKWPNPETLEAGAMSGAIFETYVVSEIIKSFYNAGKDPSNTIYYYRDKDQKEVDLLYVTNGKIYPIEIKKGISPSNPDKNFDVLSKYKEEIMAGIVVCMAKELTPINRNCWLCPIYLI